jgi:hypothetical protein
MALSSKQRAMFTKQIDQARRDLTIWRQTGSVRDGDYIETRVAVADHLVACESLLREIEWMGNSFDAGKRYVHCLICMGIKGVTGHSLTCKLAALLGPAP